MDVLLIMSVCSKSIAHFFFNISIRLWRTGNSKFHKCSRWIKNGNFSQLISDCEVLIKKVLVEK